MAEEVFRLRDEIERKTLELESLKRLLKLKEEELRLSKKSSATTHSLRLDIEAPRRKERLSNSEILRYSRQLILPEIGVKGEVLR